MREHTHLQLQIHVLLGIFFISCMVWKFYETDIHKKPERISNRLLFTGFLSPKHKITNVGVFFIFRGVGYGKMDNGVFFDLISTQIILLCFLINFFLYKIFTPNCFALPHLTWV